MIWKFWEFENMGMIIGAGGLLRRGMGEHVSNSLDQDLIDSMMSAVEV
jgi:hypothetical protein